VFVGGFPAKREINEIPKRLRKGEKLGKVTNAQTRTNQKNQGARNAKRRAKSKERNNGVCASAILGKGDGG